MSDIPKVVQSSIFKSYDTMRKDFQAMFLIMSDSLKVPHFEAGDISDGEVEYIQEINQMLERGERVSEEMMIRLEVICEVKRFNNELAAFLMTFFVLVEILLSLSDEMFNLLIKFLKEKKNNSLDRLDDVTREKINRILANPECILEGSVQETEDVEDYEEEQTSDQIEIGQDFVDGKRHSKHSKNTNKAMKVYRKVRRWWMVNVELENVYFGGRLMEPQIPGDGDQVDGMITEISDQDKMLKLFMDSLGFSIILTE